MNLDRIVSLATISALILSGAYFVIQLDATAQLLAEKLRSIDEKVSKHEGNGGHDQTRENINALTNNIARLHQITLTHEKELDRLRK